MAAVARPSTSRGAQFKLTGPYMEFGSRLLLPAWLRWSAVLAPFLTASVYTWRRIFITMALYPSAVGRSGPAAHEDHHCHSERSCIGRGGIWLTGVTLSKHLANDISHFHHILISHTYRGRSLLDAISNKWLNCGRIWLRQVWKKF
jgi:hypothetical protein